MKTQSLKFTELTLEAIRALRIQVELHEKVNLRCKNVEELIQLLELALRSNVGTLQNSLNKFIETLNPRQLTYFKSMGLALTVVKASQEHNSGKRSYRGVELPTSAQKPVAVESTDTNHKKKKVIYRGQVKWV